MNTTLSQKTLMALSLVLTSLSAHAAVELVPEVPEPSTYSLMLAGIGVMCWIARRK